MGPIKLFGFTINADKKQDQQDKLQTVVKPETTDGSIEVTNSYHNGFGVFVDLSGKTNNENALITKYRHISMHPECDEAIQDIVNEAVIADGDDDPVTINLDDTEFSAKIKRTIEEEFEYLLDLLNFKRKGYDVFKRWYIDGRLNYYIKIDSDNVKSGIQELQYVDPRRIQRVKQHIKEKHPQTGATIYKGFKEYYVYSPNGTKAVNNNSGSQQGVKLAKDAVIYVHSGILDENNTTIYSWLHKAIKPVNQLRMLEDATIIYRISRAPERRIFNVDVGNLPKVNAEKHVHDMMVKHKNKIAYNAETGELRNDRRFMTMLEDFWFPKRDGKGTTVDTLAGGQNLGEMEETEYFKRLLYKALNVPTSRIDSDNAFNMGRTSEITRDEVKFTRFIQRLRSRFTMLFDELLSKQLILKGIITEDEWKSQLRHIKYDFARDNYFSELKEMELLREKSNLVGDLEAAADKYLSRQWVWENVFKFDDEEIELIKKQREEEQEDDDFDLGGDDGDEPAPAPSRTPEPAPEPKPTANTETDNSSTKNNESILVITEEDMAAVKEMNELLSNNG